MDAAPNQPTSWRDVYTLVDDSRKEVLEEVKGVRAVIDTHLLEHAVEKATAIERERLAAAGRRRMATAAGVTRGTIALVVSVGALVLAVVRG